MTRTRTVLSVVLAALVLTPGFVGAAAAHDGDEPTDERPATDHADWVERLERVLATFDLTDDQWASVVTEAKRMHQSGADRAEIRAMVIERLEEYGIDRAEIRERRLALRLMDRFDLTAEQARTIVQEVHRLRASGANASETRAAVVERLEAYGVDRDDLRHFARDRRHSHERVHHRILHVIHRLGHHSDLTFEEAYRVGHTLHEMYHDRASWSEMRATVRAAVGNAG